MTKFDHSPSAVSEPTKFLSTDVELLPHGFLIGWSAKNIGFGETVIVWKGGTFSPDLECMDEEFVRDLLVEVAPKLAKLITDAAYPNG